MEPFLAHQGGWDEFVVLLSPLVVFAALRLFDRRRARTASSGEEQDAKPTPEGPEPG